MRSEPARVGKISLNSAEIPPRRDENFPYEHAQVGSLAKRDRVFFNQLCFLDVNQIIYTNICFA